MPTKLAQSQIAELPERVGVVETKVQHLNEKIDDIKVDIKDMHDCLDNTRDTVLAQLNVMTDEYRANAANYYKHANELNEQQSAQHAELASKITELEKIRTKGMIYGMALLAFLVGSGVAGHLNLSAILKFVGI